jgi:predicted nuclease of predicted toxin-antitoxin system
MNLSPAWVAFFESHGFDALHWARVGAPDATDRAIAEYARVENFVIVTSDLDFSAILAATGGDRPSVVQLRAQGLCIGDIGARVAVAIRAVEGQLEEGAILTVDIANERLRILPLARPRS